MTPVVHQISTLLSVALLVGCGGATVTSRGSQGWPAESTDTTIERLRRAAASSRASSEEMALLGSLEEMLGRPTEALRWLSKAVTWGAVHDNDLAAAEAAAAQIGALEGRSAHWGEVVMELARQLEGRRASPRLTFSIQGLRVRYADRHGTAEQVAQAVAAAGCLTEWQAVGPFGPFALLSFDETHGPEAPGPLRAVYDLGPGRGMSESFAPTTRGCDVELRAPQPSWGGTVYAVTYVDLDRARQVALTVDTTASARVFINDTSVMTLDRRQEYLPLFSTVHLWLPSGRSKVVVALTSRYSAPSMVVTMTDTEGRIVVSNATRTSPRGYSPARPTVLPEIETDEATELSPTRRFLSAYTSLSEGAPEQVRALLDQGSEALRQSAPGLLLRAMSWAADPTVPYDVARNRALTQLRAALELTPSAWRPYFELARHDADEERYEESLRRLRDGIERAPEQPALWMLYASLLTTRGLWSESEDAIARAAELTPGSCEPFQARLALARARHRQSDAEAAARQLVACDRSSDSLARVQLEAEGFDEAEAEIRRLLRRRGEEPLLLDSLAEVLRGRGEVDEETRTLARILERDPEDRIALLDMVDLAVAGGRTGDALDALARTMASVPSDHMMERRLHALLSESELLEPFRIDGRALIEEYEASGTSYEVPSVLVLDRTVFRIYPDGSVVELTHGITRVQSAEGIEAEGEFHVPRGAAILTARTVKADGTLLEPEDIEGKSSLSLPNLEVGDFVETEYLRGIEPPPEFPGGVWPWRFYFQGFRRAFHDSELVVVAPTGLNLDLSWRGDPLEGQRGEVGDLQVLRWVARAMGTLSDEPDSPNRDELVPSLQVSSGASWELYRHALAEALADRDRVSRELRAMARSLTDDAGNDEERLESLYRWVAENVEDGGDPLASVAHMLAARTGERTRLTAILARVAGLDVRLGLARSTYADQTDDPIPSLNMYSYPVFRVGRRWVYVGDRARWSPSCYLPADLRGQPVLMLEPEGDAHFETMEAEPCQSDHTQVTVQLTMASDGVAQGTVEETHSGGEAVRWRSLLGRTPNTERQGALEESYVADVLPGAEVTGLEILQEEELELEVTIVYQVRGIRLGETPSPGVLRVVLPYHSELASGYASLPTRETPLVVRAPVDERVLFEVELPQGATARLPATAHSITPAGEFTLEAPRGSSARSSIRLERRITLHAGRIEPEAYEAFATFCRDVDRLEQQEIMVSLP